MVINSQQICLFLSPIRPNRNQQLTNLFSLIRPNRNQQSTIFSVLSDQMVINSQRIFQSDKTKS